MILQFGAGNFLRAFADLFIDEFNQANAHALGDIVVVQSTGKERADAINQAGGNYHVAIQGFQDGKIINETVEVKSITRALHAGTEWEQVLDTGRDPSLSLILSNTTEAGLALDPTDTKRTDNAPNSFPAKLLSVLMARRQENLPGPWIAPCELIESNGDRLRELVLEQAAIWNLPTDAAEWLKDECHWINTLVDRIVPGPPKEHPLLGTDPLLLSAEPFAFWAVETDRADCPLAQLSPVSVSKDITPYTLRKVRILNGAHTALVCKAAGTEVQTVRECLEHEEIGPWLEKILFEEIVPILEGRCDDPTGFARDTLDRFRNPFLEHQLSAIALNHESKVSVRLQPTIEDYREKFGKEPPLLSGLFE
tara:strand:- start:3378 stop:4475 length:1098 start_codon:yes stop_codon:yes gene_type:complete